jgi:hypothetical protein
VQAVLDAFDELADGLGLVSGGLIGGVEFEIHAGIIAEKTGDVRHRERSAAICPCLYFVIASIAAICLSSFNSSSRAQRGDLPVICCSSSRVAQRRGDLPFWYYQSERQTAAPPSG